MFYAQSRCSFFPSKQKQIFFAPTMSEWLDEQSKLPRTKPQPMLVEYNTKAGMRLIDISREATAVYGFLYQDRVQTPLGPASVIGVNLGNLYFHVDGDSGASFWSSCKTKEDYVARGFRKIDDEYRLASQVDTKEFHNLREIIFFGEKRHIVMQSQNGPCPIIALANALLLQGFLPKVKEIAARNATITAAELRASVLDHIRHPRPVPHFCDSERQEGTLAAMITEYSRRYKNNFGAQSDSNVGPDVTDEMNNDNADVNDNRYDLGSLRAQLATSETLARFYDGLNVAPTFDCIDGFAAERDAGLFDLANIRMVHGWIMDPPEDPAAARAFNGTVSLVTRTYEELVCIAYDNPSPAQAAAAEFLQAHSSQMTPLGTALLFSELEEGDVVVLFHNNHFSTLLKRNNRLLTLVTDVSFTDRRCVVFEELSVDGDAAFYDGDGRAISTLFMSILENYRNRYSVKQLMEAEKALKESGCPKIDEKTLVEFITKPL